MSASSKNTESDDSFTCMEHFAGLIEGTKLQYDGGAVSYPLGWADLVRALVEELSAYAVDIIEITDRYGELELEFRVRNGRSETKVWRCLDKFRRASRLNCILCGDRKWGNRSNSLCRACDEMAGATGKTGTWLDKY